MTKKDLTNELSEEFNLSKIESEKIISFIFDNIQKGLTSGDEVLISGFGKFCISNRPERNGINPATKQQILIPASKVVKFKASKQVVEKIN